MSLCNTELVSGRTSRGGFVVSGREAEVFDLVGEYLTHVEIGERLFISVRTVESHVASLRRKLGMIDHRTLVREAAMSRVSPAIAALPHETTTFVGRQAELDKIASTLTDSRVVSVVGPGGTGKTRLAIKAASRWSDSRSLAAVWVDLVKVATPSEVAPTIAGALGVSEPGLRTHERAIVDILGQRPSLLVLDNCEQVLDEVAIIVEGLVSACVNLKVLLTSRVRLVVPHEQIIRLEGLDVGTVEVTGPATDLFMERSRAGGAELTNSHRSRVVDICTALDGMPLAIELAAARVATIGIDGVEHGLGDYRTLLVGGERVQTRHRSVSDTVAWSYQMLDGRDQSVLCRVSTFRTPFSAADARVIAAYDQITDSDVTHALGRLAQHSLLEPLFGLSGLRYRMLEMVRQFGREHLVSNGDTEAQDRHLEWCRLRLADLHSESDTDSETGWVEAVDLLADEVGSTLSIPDARDFAHARDVAVALAGLLFQRGRVTDAQHAFERAADLSINDRDAATDLASAAAVAKCRVAGPDALRLGDAAARTALACGEVELAVRYLCNSAQFIVRFPGMFNEPPSLDLAQALLDEAGAHSDHNPTTGFIVDSTAALLHQRATLDHLEDLVERALVSRELAQANTLLEAISIRHMEEHRPTEAVDASRRRIDLASASTLTPQLSQELRDALHTAIYIATATGHLAEAIEFADRHARLLFLRGEPYLATEEGIAPRALAGAWDEATKDGQALLEGWERAGRPVTPGRAMNPAALTMIYALRGDEDNRQAWQDTLRLMRGDRFGDQGASYDDVFSAIVALHNGQPVQAADHLATEQGNDSSEAQFRGWRFALAAEAAVLGGLPNAAEKVAEAHTAGEHSPIATAIARRAQTLHGETTWELVDIAAEFDQLGCPYQAARTLLLAGGTTAQLGSSRLRSLGATLRRNASGASNQS